MTRILTLTAVAALALGPVACNKSPEGGGPASDQTFSLTAPPGSTNVPANNSEKPITITINRSSHFGGDPIEVKDTVDDPKGVTAEFAKTKLDPTDKEVVLRVKAAPDAPRGKRTIKVTATPKTGAATTFDVSVDVVNP